MTILANYRRKKTPSQPTLQKDYLQGEFSKPLGKIKDVLQDKDTILVVDESQNGQDRSLAALLIGVLDR